MPNTTERYSLDQATEEASQIKHKIEAGEATTYGEAEKLIEKQREMAKPFANLDSRQAADLLQFFLERDDQEEFAKRALETAPFDYPGKNPFEAMKSNETFPEKGIILNMRFSEGYGGVGSVVAYDRLEEPKITKHGDRIYLDVKGRQLDFGIENPHYFYKETEPFNRMSSSSYMPHSFSGLDVVKTSDGGRALVQKKAYGTNLSYSIDSDEASNFSRIFGEGNFDELKLTIAGALQEKIGLSSVDAELVAQQVVEKMSKPVEKE